MCSVFPINHHFQHGTSITETRARKDLKHKRSTRSSYAVWQDVFHGHRKPPICRVPGEGWAVGTGCVVAMRLWSVHVLVHQKIYKWINKYGLLPLHRNLRCMNLALLCIWDNVWRTPLSCQDPIAGTGWEVQWTLEQFQGFLQRVFAVLFWWLRLWECRISCRGRGDVFPTPLRHHLPSPL